MWMMNLRNIRVAFSLRALLFGVALCGLAIGMKTNGARRQQKVVSAVRDLHGEVRYNSSTNIDGALSWIDAEHWLCSVLGKDFLYGVDSVALGSHHFDDGSLTISGMPGLVNDSICEQLADLQGLRVLWLEYTQVSDAGIQKLEALRSLEILDLEYTRCTSKSVDSLILLRSLRVLNVRGTSLTEDDIERLENALPQCQVRH